MLFGNIIQIFNTFTIINFIYIINYKAFMYCYLKTYIAKIKEQKNKEQKIKKNLNIS